MIFLGDIYIEDGDANPISCIKCGSLITKVEGYGLSGFNFEVKCTCEKCLVHKPN